MNKKLDLIVAEVKKIRAWCLVALCFACFTQVAMAAEPEVFKLENGQTVVLQQVPNSKLVCVDTWVKTGSINETDENSGVAHFLEHLFFKGSAKHKAGDFERILDGKGAIYNAATSKDFTHFYITIKKEDLSLALDLQSDMLLSPQIPQNEMDRERMVVLEEISRSKDDPNSIVFQNINSILFKQHPYKREVIGSADVIKNISREGVLEFYNTWYKPSNMTTVIVGDIDKEKALALVGQDFCQPIEKIEQKSKYIREPELTKIETKIQRGKYNTAYLQMAFKGCEFKETKDTYALDLLSVILGQGNTSYLYKALKENKNLVTYVDTGHYSLRDDSIFYVSAGLNSENYSAVENEIINQISGIRCKGVTPEELQRAKNILERSYIYSNESVENIANAIGYDMALGGDLHYYSTYISEIKKVTDKDILRVANQYLDPNKMAVSLLLPENFKVGESSDEFKPQHIASRAEGLLIYNYKPETPVAPVASVVLPPRVYKNTTKGGAQLIIEKNDASDVVAAEVFIKGGEFLAKPGVCEILTKTLTRGTKTMTAQEISKKLEDDGIIVSPTVNPDYLQISVKSTKADFDKAFAILTDILNNATFPESEVTKAKKDLLEEIKFEQDQPQSVALDMLKSKIYPQKPYGFSINDVKAAMPKITRADVANYYYSYFAPQNMVISVSGNVDVCDVRTKFDTFVTRQGKPVDIKKFITPFSPIEESSKLITKKRTQSAWVMMGQRACSIRDEKDFATLKVINSILSGGMSSRLFIDMREKKGLAYEVGCSYPTLYDNSYFVLYIGTNPKNIELVQKEFKNEINLLLTKPVSQGELDLAKQRLIGYVALGQETNAQRSSQRGRYELLNKGYNFSDKYEKLIESVSADDIIKVSNKYFKQPFVVAIVEPIED